MKAPKLDSNDYYEVLGVEKGDDAAKIKKAFRRLAIKYHPDKAKGSDAEKAKAEENFKKISEAYEVLSDPEKRKTYDHVGKSGFQSGGFTNPEDLFSAVFGSSFGKSSDPFENIFNFGFGGPAGGGSSFQFSTGGPGSGFQSFQNGGMGSAPFGGQQAGGLGGLGGLGDMMGMFSQMHGNMGGPGGGFPQGFGQRGMRRKRKRFGILEEGSVVFLKKLKTEYLNEYQAEVKYYDEAKQRYVVLVEDFGEISVKRENLQQVVRGVTVTGLKSRSDLNGKQGIVFETKENLRCIVRIKGTSVSISTENIIFPEGTNVQIKGLKNAKFLKYNEKWGTIKVIDQRKQRYLVQLNEQEQVSVKYGNVTV
eukprot:snap_masked-scaffold_48-processed-gene-0.20-mRNA-1 protein AED:0.15 eAED:0.57 QI:0/-1/0/1/-1/1/1/0/363